MAPGMALHELRECVGQCTTAKPTDAGSEQYLQAPFRQENNSTLKHRKHGSFGGINDTDDLTHGISSMSIDVELALVLGLFMIGAVVLAVDNLVYALSKRLKRWMRNRKSVPHDPAALTSARKKRL